MIAFLQNYDIMNKKETEDTRMPQRKNRYSQMSRQMTLYLLADLLVFILFLVVSGYGIIWLKVLTAIITIVGSLLCLAFLYLSKELLKQRSLWMTAAAAAILLCTFFSLILNFPSPTPTAEDLLYISHLL